MEEHPDRRQQQGLPTSTRPMLIDDCVVATRFVGERGAELLVETPAGIIEMEAVLPMSWGRKAWTPRSVEAADAHEGV